MIGNGNVTLRSGFSPSPSKRSITIQNPYFLPDPDAREALLDAVRRGVSVRVMIPDSHATDAKLVSHASHHHYGTLLRGGIRLFDYQRTLLHSTGGGAPSARQTSTTVRSRSTTRSRWSCSTRPSRGISRRPSSDLKHARERTIEVWSKRPILHKLKDGAAFLLNEQL